MGRGAHNAMLVVPPARMIMNVRAVRRDLSQLRDSARRNVEMEQGFRLNAAMEIRNQEMGAQMNVQLRKDGFVRAARLHLLIRVKRFNSPKRHSQMLWKLGWWG